MPAARRILLRSGKSPFEALSPGAVLQRGTGGANLGNLVFSDAVHKMLSVEGTEITSTEFSDDLWDAGWVNERFDVLVLPFANAFRQAFKVHLHKWTRLISQLKIPVVVLGIGAQSTVDREFAPLKPMDEAVKEFTAAVLDKSPSIGVRGEFTAEYLRHLGFRDVEVIGCPSMFRNGPDMAVEKTSESLSRDARIAVSMTPGTRGELPGIIESNAQRYPNLTYFAQDLNELELLYWGDTSVEAGRYADYPKHRSHPLFQDNRVRLHLDPETWIGGLAQQDFAFGSRIHGTVTALLGGTPSVVLCHDSRTLELCEYFDIPYRRLVDLPAGTDAAALYAEADYSRLVDGHAERFARMTGYLDKHGLDHVYAPGGDGGAEFERRMAEIDLPAPVEVWAPEDGAMSYRIGWLRENTKDLTKELEKSQRQLEKAQGQIATLEKQVADLTRKTAEVKSLAARVTALENSLYHRAWQRIRSLLRRNRKPRQ